MTLEQLAKKFVAEIKAGQIGEALDTASDILKSTAGFYKLVFGGAATAAVSEAEDAELEELETELGDLSDGIESDIEDGEDGEDGELKAASSPAGMTPETILALVQIVLQIIAERRKRKQ